MLLPDFLWDPVTTNCKGGLESAIIYELPEVLVEPAGFIRRCYAEPDTGDEACQDEIVYEPPVLAGVTETPETRYPLDDVYTPGPGGVTFVEVGARDEAGNRSGEECL